MIANALGQGMWAFDLGRRAGGIPMGIWVEEEA